MTIDQQSGIAVADAEDLLRLVLAELPAIIWSTDRELRFTCSTGAGLSGLRLKHGQTVGTTLYEFFQTEDPDFPPVDAHHRALRGESVSYEHEWEGCTFQVRVEPLWDESGVIVGCIGIANDLSRQKQAERELLEAQQDLERRVAERTAELAKANRKLQREVDQRQRAEAAVRREQEQLRRLLEQYDRDRQLVAYEIHDGLAQELAAAVMHIQALADLGQKSAAARDDLLRQGLEALANSMHQTRQLISALRSPAFDQIGFIASVEDFLQQAKTNSRDVEIEFAHRGDFRGLTTPLANALFRIIQESLANARRHSKSERIRVRLTRQADRVQVEVHDWGVGFDPGKVRENCFGLEGIRERARLFGGSALIESAPGWGTRVVVDLPLSGNGRGLEAGG